MTAHAQRCYYCERLSRETLQCFNDKREVMVDFKEQFNITDAAKLKRVFGGKCQSFERRWTE